MRTSLSKNIALDVVASYATTSKIALAGSILGFGLIGAHPAQAATFTYSGDTTASPTWNRPDGTSNTGTNGFVPNTLSGVISPYSAFQFNVDTAGSYDFQSTSTSLANDNNYPVGTNWDNFTFLYAGSFDPNNPLTNAIVGNDDFPAFLLGKSFFSTVLNPGTNYFLVTTGFFPSQRGTFNNSITGNGNIFVGSAAVPEPFTIVGTLIGGTAALRMRKKLKSANKA